jgi:ATP-dependent Lhr-like helicase
MTDEELQRLILDEPAASEFRSGERRRLASFLETLVSEKRIGRLTQGRSFWLAAERLHMLQAVYPDAGVQPELKPPESELRKTWERSDAVRELLRGRMEIIGPVTVEELASYFGLAQKEIESALLALEAEGFILRGKFHPGTAEMEWCDRRLLARIHRLTINRLRAEIQPVSIAEFQRFLFAWQRVAPEHRAAGPDGLEAALELLDGYELPAAAWEPEVLSLRVCDYSPQWLDQLCLAGRIGWGRLTPPHNRNGRPSIPIRSSPISFFVRSHLMDWLQLCDEPVSAEQTPDTKRVLEILDERGAMFFGELVQQTGLLPSRVEEALAELVAQGWVTSDSFEGLRALLVPQEKRVPFADLDRKRRHKAVSSVEFAGRWALLRRIPSAEQSRKVAPGSNLQLHAREHALETVARTLMRRYGLVFRRLLERESFNVSWYELGRVYRTLEARGEIRGGYFVGGVSGEQFALPEAIGLLRSIRKAPAQGELVAISAADPLNLAGILIPGPRLTAITSNRILLRDGVPVASLEAGRATRLNGETQMPDHLIERTLCVGTMAPSLRPYYA